MLSPPPYTHTHDLELLTPPPTTTKSPSYLFRPEFDCECNNEFPIQHVFWHAYHNLPKHAHTHTYTPLLISSGQPSCSWSSCVCVCVCSECHLCVAQVQIKCENKLYVKVSHPEYMCNLRILYIHWIYVIHIYLSIYWYDRWGDRSIDWLIEFKWDDVNLFLYIHKDDKPKKITFLCSVHFSSNQFRIVRMVTVGDDLLVVCHERCWSDQIRSVYDLNIDHL